MGNKVVVDTEHRSEEELDAYAEEHGIDQVVFIEEEEDSEEDENT